MLQRRQCRMEAEAHLRVFPHPSLYHDPHLGKSMRTNRTRSKDVGDAAAPQQQAVGGFCSRLALLEQGSSESYSAR